VIGTGENGSIEMVNCAAAATKSAPPRTSTVSVSQPARGKTATRRVAAFSICGATLYGL